MALPQKEKPSICSNFMIINVCPMLKGHILSILSISKEWKDPNISQFRKSQKSTNIMSSISVIRQTYLDMIFLEICPKKLILLFIMEKELYLQINQLYHQDGQTIVLNQIQNQIILLIQKDKYLSLRYLDKNRKTVRFNGVINNILHPFLVLLYFNHLNFHLLNKQ